MKITFIGHGYVGLVSATIFADLGNTVNVIGHTPKTVDNLNKGIVHIYEPGLTELVQKNLAAKRLRFGLSYEPVKDSELIFIGVGTPPGKGGEADLTTVLEVAENIGKNLSDYAVVITKSTVPIGTNKKIKALIEKVKPSKVEFDVASCPEFLRQGSALSDTLYPDRIVIGTETKKAEDLLVQLHKPLQENSNCPVVLCNLETAEMIKYAANSFLAMKISFANSIAQLSEATGADAMRVLEGIGFDKRIGNYFLQPGPGYGGSCFPKDVKALIAIAEGYKYDFKLLKEVENVNLLAKRQIVKKAEELLKDVKGKKIGILGLAFKPNTDDMRFAPSIEIIEWLKEKGAAIHAHDPQSMEKAKKVISGISFYEDMYDVARDAELLIIVTDWNEFKEMDLSKIRTLMAQPNLIDARNIYDPEKLKNLGFSYRGVGR